MTSSDKYVKEDNSALDERSIPRVIRELIQREEKKKQLFENYDYIDWLVEFTKRCPHFTDIDWACGEGDISPYNHERVQMLGIFFEGIHDFASKNYINSLPCHHGTCYCIKYHDKCYIVGVLIGQGSLVYCDALDENTDSFIDFDELLVPTEKTLLRTAMIDNQLERIDDLFYDLYRKGVPHQAIHARANKLLKEIKEKI